jgi:hypothetical protein
MTYAGEGSWRGAWRLWGLVCGSVPGSFIFDPVVMVAVGKTWVVWMLTGGQIVPRCFTLTQASGQQV